MVAMHSKQLTATRMKKISPNIAFGSLNSCDQIKQFETTELQKFRKNNQHSA